METIQTNLKPVILKNRLFINAVDYLIEKKIVDNSKDFCERIKISESTLSNIRNDKKMVSDKTINKLLDVFPGIFNSKYFRGENIYMLIDEYMQAKNEAENNSDQHGQPTMSSMVNANVSAYAEAINAMKIALDERNMRIEELKSKLADKDEIIAQLKARLISYRSIIDKNGFVDLSNYPFTIGASEQKGITK